MHCTTFEWCILHNTQEQTFGVVFQISAMATVLCTDQAEDSDLLLLLCYHTSRRYNDMIFTPQPKQLECCPRWMVEVRSTTLPRLYTLDSAAATGFCPSMRSTCISPASVGLYSPHCVSSPLMTYYYGHSMVMVITFWQTSYFCDTSHELKHSGGDSWSDVL